MKRTHGTAFAAKQKKAVKRKTTGGMTLVGKSNYQLGRTHPTQPKAELKCFDLASTSQALSAAGVFVTLNAIPQGADFFQRIGRKVYNKSIRVTGFINNTATSATQEYGRVIIYYDSQPNAAIPALADLLQNANAAAATNNFSEININNRERFQILRDRRFILPPLTNTAGQLTNFQVIDQLQQSFNIDEFIKLRGLEAVYNATNGGTIADITSGSIGMLTLGSTGNWEFTFSTRLRYYD